MNKSNQATDEVRIWIPLYCADTLAETARLTTRQIGAYLLLKIEYWLNGPLPDDDAILRQITHLERSQWKLDGPAVKAIFPKGADGNLHNGRIDDLKLEAVENRRTAKERSEKANAVRWGRKTAGSALGFTSSTPSRTPEGILKQSSSPLPAQSTLGNAGTGNQGPAASPVEKKANGKNDVNPLTDARRYAKAMFDRLHIPAGETLMARAAEAIHLNAADCNVTLEESTALIERAASEAQASGEIIKPWWFEDRKYKLVHQKSLAESVQGIQRKNSAGTDDENMSREKIIDYLKHCSLELLSKSTGLSGLQSISEELRALAEAVDKEKLGYDSVTIEEKLEPMDGCMFSVLESAADAEKIADIKAGVRAEHGARWALMNEKSRRDVELQGTFQRLRESFHLPRLSLFNMQSNEQMWANEPKN